MLEWGLNWCITAYCHHLLVLHAATVARGEHALILPAPPGSGKSTLCAALVQRGWRLLSDELTLIDLRDGRVHGLARPVNLKNQSIEVIRRFAPQAFLSRPVHDTAKGTVALMAAPAESVAQSLAPVWPRWVALPRWSADAETRLEPLPPGEAFLHLADNAMNYHILAEQGFGALGRLIDGAEAFHFGYSDLDEAVATFDALAEAAQ
jgi:HprK-related kinase A